MTIEEIKELQHATVNVSRLLCIVADSGYQVQITYTEDDVVYTTCYYTPIKDVYEEIAIVEIKNNDEENINE